MRKTQLAQVEQSKAGLKTRGEILTFGREGPKYYKQMPQKLNFPHMFDMLRSQISDT